MTDLERRLRDICADARAHGHTMIDVAAVERLLDRHHEYDRLDLLAGDQFDRLRA